MKAENGDVMNNVINIARIKNAFSNVIQRFHDF